MKKLALVCLAALGLSLVGCKSDANTETPKEAQPTVALEKGLENVNSVTFTLTTTNATEARYMVLGDEATAPALDVIMTEGVAVTLNENGAAEVEALDLEAATSYKIVAAAKNKTLVAGSNTLYVTTTAQAELALDVDVVGVTHNTMNFRYTATNAESLAYLVQSAAKEIPEASEVLRKGDELDPASKEAVEVKDLDNVKEYVLLVAAEGMGQTLLAEPVYFTTEDDPANVIEHNYTRVKGSKYSSNYYLMFSYEDANEADNFAYNDKTLCLDFYGDPDKDYLPAGTYEVKESTEWPCVNSMRYSTYGYDNGVLLKSGAVEVSIDPDTKAYTFVINLQLKDGRSLAANYTGDVDGMPVIDKVFVTTDYTSAKATTTDNGLNWALTLADDAGNTAYLNLANAFQAPYIVNNTYTISTSAEEFSVKALAAEAGQFDNTTSTFVVAGENGGEFKFATGTLTVDIDWDAKEYLMSFYGTLENGYIIESEYKGSVEGCSLEQSEEVIDVTMNRAYASSYESGANWYITLSQVDGELTNYMLKLDVYCTPSQFLAPGVYELGVGTGEGYLGVDATTLTVSGQSQYNFTEARLTVETNLADKTYTMVVSGKVQDGRTFLMSYIGAVDGMEIVDAEDTPSDLTWSTFSARKWYSDNWELTIKDSTEQYTIAFDMRTGDSSADHISSGVYTLGESYVDTVYIDNNYSTFNGSKKAFSEVNLNLQYDESAKTYSVSFSVVLTDGREFNGTYTGPIAGSPAA
ncbi:MAG: hypothetical protein J6Q33_00975 [Alistipes sp.]|nr:hypothetical protein [Alistipes sp.]